jgi:GDP-D-mannose dehydratase
MKQKKAIIFGITGQDGSYLAEFLLKKIILFMVLKEDLLVLIQKELIIFLIALILKVRIFLFITVM